MHTPSSQETFHAASVLRFALPLAAFISLSLSAVISSRHVSLRFATLRAWLISCVPYSAYPRINNVGGRPSRRLVGTVR
ncbi:hypothetical protein BC567DRAFT_232017 [Phyllosticta citribraziliensis]